MPIYSDDEAEIEDRLASLLAGAGATTSLAASAAAALRLNPDIAELPPRLKAALESTVHVVERAADLDISILELERSAALRFPEELVAKLAQRSPEGTATESVKEAIKSVLADLRSLLAGPAPEVAERMEEFLTNLSQTESAQAQSLARGSLDLEFLGTPLAS